ncbi:hypothetical protein FB567DRAFT_534238 [Paraphoma chrysanthemicola]|uniref:Uncharacterized protein n=1 Tax=Paraphoma chrysanthemicola TaxID=798071 RepID=A0A8K0QYR1_9PLEO|nr:hypothetical protein FB567DRAFT_534238 [Paraphoma chrysanthemicola]
MAVANLHTLDSDILFEILTACDNLVTLRNLILTHPVLYHTFNNRRRLILRTVLRTQYHVHFLRRPHEHKFGETHSSILLIKTSNVIDRVALREAPWPELKRLMPEVLSCKWASWLLGSYNQAGLQDEALLLARESIRIMLAKCKILVSEQSALARAVIRTYTTANLQEEALELDEAILQHLSPRQPDYSVWAKQLITTYQKTGHDDKILPLQLKCWETCKTCAGAASDYALDWARSIIRGYQLKGEDAQAIAFQETVRTLLDPRTPQYIAWSRQLIQMHQKSNQPAEALAVTQSVWRHLGPETKGYRPWTAQLSEQYDTLGRPDDALAVVEAAWTAIGVYLARFPNDIAWKYQARGAGLMLAKAYRRHQRIDEAIALEVKCKALSV